MATSSMKRRIAKLEARIQPKSGGDDEQWDLSGLTDEELEYLERHIESGATQADARILEIAKKCKLQSNTHGTRRA